jgi:hypothetical protein
MSSFLSSFQGTTRKKPILPILDTILTPAFPVVEAILTPVIPIVHTIVAAVIPIAGAIKRKLPQEEPGAKSTHSKL